MPIEKILARSNSDMSGVITSSKSFEAHWKPDPTVLLRKMANQALRIFAIVICQARARSRFSSVLDVRGCKCPSEIKAGRDHHRRKSSGGALDVESPWEFVTATCH